MSETDVPVNPEGIRVLATDANVVSLAYLVAVLKKCKYNVTSTTKADEALEILRNSKEKHDLVITDVKRLDMDGFRLLEIVSQEMDLPVIFVTAEDNQSSIMKGITHGARDYLLKPVRIQEIKNIWQHVVRKRLSSIEKSSSTREIKSEELKASENLEATVTKKEDGEGEEAAANSESDNSSSHHKKPRLKWSQELHIKFVNAVQQLEDVIHPKKIMKIMKEPGLTRDQVASHLQKYRRKLKEEKEKTSQLQSETSSKPFIDMQSTLYSARNHELLKLHQNTIQFPFQTQQWMMPDLAVPEFKELNFSPTFLSAMKLPDEYMGNSSLSSSYNVHRVPPASSSFPFCSYIPNASLNPPRQVPEQAAVETGAILQHAIASGHGQISSGREEGGYFNNYPSNSRGHFNDYPLAMQYPTPLSVQYPTQMDSMKNNEWNFARHPYEKSQHVQGSFYHNSSSNSCDDLTELVQQFANDEPPKL